MFHKLGINTYCVCVCVYSDGIKGINVFTLQEYYFVFSFKLNKKNHESKDKM